MKSFDVYLGTILLLSVAGSSASTKHNVRGSDAMDENNAEERLTSGLNNVVKYTQTSVSNVAAVVRQWQEHKSSLEMERDTKTFDSFQVNGNFLATLMSPNMEDLMKSFANKQARLIDLFTSRYGDVALIQALIVAKKKTEETKEIATTLQLELFKKWWRDGTSIDDIVTDKLHLPNDLRALSNERLHVLEDYLHFSYTKTPSTSETLLQVLTNHFGGEHHLVEIVGQGKANIYAFEKAKSLETALIAKWLDKNWHPANLLHQLHMDESVEALRSPSLKIVANYIVEYNKQCPVCLTDPNKEFSLLMWYTDRFGDAAVAEALVKATKMDTTKQLATTLQNELVDRWLESRKTIEQVFELLKLKQEGPRVFTSSKLEILEHFSTRFNARYNSLPNPPRLLSILRENLGDSDFAINLAMNIQSSSTPEPYNKSLKWLFNQWAKTHVNPKSDIFTNVQEQDLEIVEFILSKYTQFSTEKQTQLYTFSHPRR